MHKEEHIVRKLMEQVDSRISCKSCSETFSIHHNTNTLLRHLEKEHPTKIRDERRLQHQEPGNIFTREALLAQFVELWTVNLTTFAGQ